MERRKEKTKEIHVTTQSSSSNCSHADQIPFDLTRQILLSLPAKSLMRFRCVSKLWASVISDPDFIISFTTQSSVQRSCLLLNFQSYDKQLFFSLTQQKKNLEMCLPHVEKYHLPLQKKERYKSKLQFQSVHGLISFQNSHHIVIWNPSMGQYVTYQKPYNSKYSKSYFGYDPIGNTYKLLSISYGSTDEHYVLTLGAQESWRRIKGFISPYYFSIKGICINGVLFFISGIFEKEIMSFDVRTEKFKTIQAHSLMHESVMTNFFLSPVSYKGKLGCIILESSFYKLWVLEDVEKEEWSCKDFHLPISQKDPIVKVDYLLSSVTDDGEFIYVSVSWHDKEMYVSYYDPLRNSNRKIKIEIFEDDDFWLHNNGCQHNWTFNGSLPNHIENLMSLKDFTCSFSL